MAKANQPAAKFRIGYVTATVWTGGYREGAAVTLGNFDYDFTQLVVNFGYRF